MGIDRRTFVGATSLVLSTAALSDASTVSAKPKDAKSSRRIATEEAFSIPEVAEALRAISRGPSNSLDMLLLRAIYDSSPGDFGAMLRERLLDLEGLRLKEMDDNGVAVHLLSLTAPGVQMFDADTAVELATLANDRLAEVIARHPTRFAGSGELRAAGRRSGRQGNGARHQPAQAQRLHRQLAHQQRVP